MSLLDQPLHEIAQLQTNLHETGTELHGFVLNALIVEDKAFNEDANERAVVLRCRVGGCQSCAEMSLSVVDSSHPDLYLYACADSCR